MKTSVLPVVLLYVAGAFGLHAAPSEKTEFRTEVVFFEREKFTDARDGYNGTDKGRDYQLEQLKTHLRERAQSFVQPGEKLLVTIKDVDLAGEFEPWRTGAGMSDVRIVKEIYPPRIALTFQLTGANGEVLKQGTRELRDLMFQRTAIGTFDQPLRYEKTMIEDWLRTEFSQVKRS